MPLQLTEYPDLDLCKNIYKHIEIWTQDKQKVKAYCDEALQNGSVKVSYETKGVVGRFYPTNIKQRLTATVMWRRLRATLFSNTEYDIDIVNCHACLMLGLVEKLYPNFDVSCLKKYTENRENIINNFNLKKSCPFLFKRQRRNYYQKRCCKIFIQTLCYMVEQLKRGLKNSTYYQVIMKYHNLLQTSRKKLKQLLRSSHAMN